MDTQIQERLSDEERDLLSKCEETIRKTKKSAWDFIEALSTIRAQRLFRETYENFEAYCQEVHGFGRNYANKLIAAAEVRNAIKLITQSATENNKGTQVPLPETETQVREIATLPPEKQPEAWAKSVEASGGKQPKPATVKEVVKEIKATIAESTQEAIASLPVFTNGRTPKQGQQVSPPLNDDEVDTSIRKLIKSFDERAKLIGSKGEHYKTCTDSLQTTVKHWHKWRKAGRQP